MADTTFSNTQVPNAEMDNIQDAPNCYTPPLFQEAQQEDTTHLVPDPPSRASTDLIAVDADDTFLDLCLQRDLMTVQVDRLEQLGNEIEADLIKFRQLHYAIRSQARRLVQEYERALKVVRDENNELKKDLDEAMKVVNQAKVVVDAAKQAGLRRERDE